MVAAHCEFATQASTLKNESYGTQTPLHTRLVPIFISPLRGSIKTVARLVVGCDPVVDWVGKNIPLLEHCSEPVTTWSVRMVSKFLIFLLFPDWG